MTTWWGTAALLLPLGGLIVFTRNVPGSRRSLTAVVLVVVAVSGCLSPVDDLGEDGAGRSALLASQPPSPEASSPCGGSAVPVTDVADARARLQRRWLRCGRPSGRVAEAPPFVRDVVAFEVENDTWFALVPREDGGWRRLDDLDHRGSLSWWAMGNVGVSFGAGTTFTPAILAYSTAGVRLELYPGVVVNFVPLP